MLTAEDGTFRRAKGGKVKRSKSEMVPNASAKYVVGHHKRQLAQLIGIDPDDRHNRADALAAFEQLDADGVIELNKEGHGRGEKYFIYGRNRAVDADYEVS